MSLISYGFVLPNQARRVKVYKLTDDEAAMRKRKWHF